LLSVGKRVNMCHGESKNAERKEFFT